jgi:hypothetical protein
VIVNLTPRVVRIYNPDRPNGVDDIDLGLRQTFDPASQAAALDPMPLVTTYQDDVPVELIEYGHADNLPAARDDVFYIVPSRSPCPSIRDAPTFSSPTTTSTHPMAPSSAAAPSPNPSSEGP